MWVYKKNHAGNANATQQDLTAYLELYINFKLKVLDAKANNLDADTAYRKEITGYENALKALKKKSPKNAEYDFIMNEYREGVLMFNISEVKVWSKVQDNEIKLLDFYNRNAAVYAGKSFYEVRGLVINDYQHYLENEWIKTLRAKYTVKLNKDELKKLAKL